LASPLDHVTLHPPSGSLQGGGSRTTYVLAGAVTHLSAVIYFIVVDPWWKRASFGDASAEREVVCESIYSVDLLTPWVVSSSFGGGTPC